MFSLAASDRTIRFSPSGATTMASMSLSEPCVRLWKVTVTLLIGPDMPDTVMDDG